MSKINKWCAALALVVLIAMTAGPGPASAARRAPLGPPVQDVKVVNSDSEPVPVSIPEPLLVNVDDTQFTRIPFTRSANIFIGDGSERSFEVLLRWPDDLPDGWTLVVHSFSYQFGVSGGQKTRVRFCVRDQSSICAYMPQVEPFVTAGGDYYYQDAVHMPLYARNPMGSNDILLSVFLERSDDTGNAVADVSVAGYLIPPGAPHLAP